MGVALLIILHMLTNGSRAYVKRKLQDLAATEDGTFGQIKKRRDAGIKRGHKEGSLPHFLREQSSQRAGEQLEEPAEFDSHVRDALENCPDDPLNSARWNYQTRLVVQENILGSGAFLGPSRL